MGIGTGGAGAGYTKWGHFSIKIQGLPTFDGDKDAEKLITFLAALERAFSLRAMETGTTGLTQSWGEYAIQRLTGRAANWAHLTWRLNDKVLWDDFKAKMAQQFIPADYLNKLRMAFANLAWDSKRSLADFQRGVATM